MIMIFLMENIFGPQETFPICCNVANDAIGDVNARTKLQMIDEDKKVSIALGNCGNEWANQPRMSSGE